MHDLVANSRPPIHQGWPHEMLLYTDSSDPMWWRLLGLWFDLVFIVGTASRSTFRSVQAEEGLSLEDQRVRLCFRFKQLPGGIHHYYRELSYEDHAILQRERIFRWAVVGLHAVHQVAFICGIIADFIIIMFFGGLRRHSRVEGAIRSIDWGVTIILIAIDFLPKRWLYRLSTCIPRTYYDRCPARSDQEMDQKRAVMECDWIFADRHDFDNRNLHRIVTSFIGSDLDSIFQLENREWFKKYY